MSQAVCSASSHLIPLLRAIQPPSGFDTNPTQCRTESSMPRFVLVAPSTSTVNCVESRWPKLGLSIRGTAMHSTNSRHRDQKRAAARGSFIPSLPRATDPHRPDRP